MGLSPSLSEAVPVRRGGRRTSRESAAPVSHAVGLAKSLVTLRRGSARAFRARIDRSRSPRQDRPCVGPRAPWSPSSTSMGIKQSRTASPRRGQSREAGCFRIGAGAWVAFRAFDVGGRVAVLGRSRHTRRDCADGAARLPTRRREREPSLSSWSRGALERARLHMICAFSLHARRKITSKRYSPRADTESRAHLTRLLAGGS